MIAIAVNGCSMADCQQAMSISAVMTSNRRSSSSKYSNQSFEHLAVMLVKLSASVALDNGSNFSPSSTRNKNVSSNDHNKLCVCVCQFKLIFISAAVGCQ